MSEHWENISQCLTTTCFSYSNQISTRHSNRYRLTLNRKGRHKLLFFNQLNYWVRQPTLIPIFDRLQAIDPSYLNIPIHLPELLNLFLTHFADLSALNVKALFDVLNVTYFLLCIKLKILLSLSLALLLLLSIHFKHLFSITASLQFLHELIFIIIYKQFITLQLRLNLVFFSLLLHFCQKLFMEFIVILFVLVILILVSC